ncbi:hypothetical protein LCGC14_1224100, partial [marine sediment metagenome]
NLDSIILGVERVSIGKMDTVIILRRTTSTEEWIPTELSGWDDTKFQVFDMLTIQENNIRKLIVASKTGLYQTIIQDITDLDTITSPIFYTTIAYTKSDLQQFYENNVLNIIPEDSKSPVYYISKISYKTSGSNQWNVLSSDKFRGSRNEIRIDVSSIWSTLTDLKIAYSFESFQKEVRTSIDPSFNIESGTSNYDQVSALGTFFADLSLPLSWLNRGTSYQNPTWHRLPNGMTYQDTPVISGLGSTVLYPNIKYGWQDEWGYEYTTMPELENSLIYYGDDYDSGQLSQYLNSKNDYLGEGIFGGKYSNNYVKEALISNPYLGESFDFRDMYYPGIHNAANATGLYHYYNGAQYTLVTNELKDIFGYNTADVFRYDSGGLPFSMTPLNSSLEEYKVALLNWSQYVAVNKTEYGEFGLGFTYKLPVISKYGADAIYLSFDASIVSSSFWKDYPLSIQFWNYVQNQWQSTNIAPLDGTGYYDNDKLDSDFWTWNPTSTSNFGQFRPTWSTQNNDDVNTISYGNIFPNIVDQSGNIIINESIKNGASFLGYFNDDLSLNNFYSDNFKFLTYDSNYDTNKFQLDAIKINISDFYTTTTTFPLYNTSQSFSNINFYDNFLNDFHEFKVRIITEKESQQDAGAEANLAIGDFKTYVQAKTDYLNYDEFESNAIQGRHLSDKISLTSDGVELTGFSGFNIKGTQTNQKFYENFWKNEWTLLGTQQDTMTINQNIVQDTKVSAANPNTNFNGQVLSVKNRESVDETFIELNQVDYLTSNGNDILELKIEINDEIISWGEYTGTSFDTSSQIYVPSGITWDGTYFYVLERYGEVYKYSSTGTYTGIWYDLNLPANDNPNAIVWDGTNFWVVSGSSKAVYKFTDTFTYTGTSFDTSSQTFLPQGLTWDGTNFWVLDYYGEIYKYTSTGTYTGNSYDTGTQDSRPKGITFDGNKFWMVGKTTDEVYQYTSSWGYTGVHFDISSEMYDATDLIIEGSNIWVSERSYNIIYKYEYASPNPSNVGFNFDNYLNGENDFYVHFIGRTNGFTSKLIIDGIDMFNFGSSFLEDGTLAMDAETIKAWIANPGDNLERELILDYLVIELLNQSITFDVDNKPISIDTSLSHKQQTLFDNGPYNDPYLGTSIHFTLKNSIQSPIFGRDNALIYADLELTDLDLNFSVYPSPPLTGFSLGYPEVEGNNEVKYDPTSLKDYSVYSNSRFRQSAMDDIQIPLMTPILLDFSQYSIEDFESGSLSLSLDLDIALKNRKQDSDWSMRYRLLYYNYTTGYWEDFKGNLYAKNKGDEATVWNPGSYNFINYLQNPEGNMFIPISDDNNIQLNNPITITSLNSNTIQDSIMKLAFISYILPSNYSIESDPDKNYFVYDRADPLVPIEISQELEVLECLIIEETKEIIYPEATLLANLPLNQNYKANLSSLNNLGEIVSVTGRYLDSNSIPYKYPIQSYWITSQNELAFNSPMKYFFTNITIEYIPQLNLIYNSTDGNWYLPDSFIGVDYNFTNPFFISDLWVNETYFGTYIHPDVNVNYTIASNTNGVYVIFDNPINSDSTVKGSVHFGKRNEINLYKFSLKDNLLFAYNILSDAEDYQGGTLQLGINIGFKDVIYSELTQVSSGDYKFSVILYQLDLITGYSISIGSSIINLDSQNLGFHYYTLNLDLNNFDFGTQGNSLFLETITRNKDFDLLISIESSASSFVVDGNLFKGKFAQELISANLAIGTEKSQLSYNDTNVQEPYIPIAQSDILLSQSSSGTYLFDSTSLDYDFDFQISELRAGSTILTNNTDYLFDEAEKLITLIGIYNDYDGFLSADISYKAFEWSKGFVS